MRNLALGKTIVLMNPYSARYPGSGIATLIDGRRGSLDHGDGSWQAYEGVDLEASIDLGEAAPVRRITAGFLSNPSAWIFLPNEVEIAVSRDGTHYDVVKKIQTEQNVVDLTPRTQDFEARLSTPSPVRYIRVTGRNIGVCPAEHPGAGEKAWLFADEIVVE